MLKVNITETPRSSLDHQVDKTVLNQSLKVAEAISDLSRATGDFSLYGNVPDSAASSFMIDRKLSLPRLLLSSCGLQKLHGSPSLHGHVFVLRYFPAILVAKVDRSTSLSNNVLRRGISHIISVGLDFHERFYVVSSLIIAGLVPTYLSIGPRTFLLHMNREQNYTAACFRQLSGLYMAICPCSCLYSPSTVPPSPSFPRLTQG